MNHEKNEKNRFRKSDFSGIQNNTFAKPQGVTIVTSIHFVWELVALEYIIRRHSDPLHVNYILTPGLHKGLFCGYYIVLFKNVSCVLFPQEDENQILSKIRRTNLKQFLRNPDEILE